MEHEQLPCRGSGRVGTWAAHGTPSRTVGTAACVDRARHELGAWTACAIATAQMLQFTHLRVLAFFLLRRAHCLVRVLIRRVLAYVCEHSGEIQDEHAVLEMLQPRLEVLAVHASGEHCAV